MATTIDDLIYLKDEAVTLAHDVVRTLDGAEWAQKTPGEKGAALTRLRSHALHVQERSLAYDEAEECETCSSIEDHEQTKAAVAALNDEGWPSVATDLGEGVPIETLESRLRELQTEGEDVSKPLEILAGLF